MLDHEIKEQERLRRKYQRLMAAGFGILLTVVAVATVIFTR